jgi:serine/threonine protein kinase
MPAKLGRYEIERLLGSGTMGAVYLARDNELDRRVAIKVPNADQHEDPEIRERFHREARAAATLHHRNICPVYDIGETDGIRYITMAYVEGKPLSDVIAARGPSAQYDAARIVRTLAGALQKAHEKGVIHRDLKPANVMIDEDGEPVIMDFGLARQINRAEDARLTQSGSVIGSPAYMPPEQIECELEKIGPATDVYSLGVIFYELLTGRIPFRGSIAAVMGQVITSQPEKPSKRRPELDSRLESICLKMMSKQIDDRYPSMADVASALTEALRTEHAAPNDLTAVGINDSTHTATTSTQPTQRSTETSGVGPASTQPVSPTAAAFHVPKWVLWLALGLVAIGFGITWKMMTLMMGVTQDSATISVPKGVRDSIREDQITPYLDGQELSIDQLGEPLHLEPGPHVIELRHGETPLLIEELNVVEGEAPQLAIERDEGGSYVFKHIELPADADPEAVPPSSNGQSDSPLD